MKLRIFLFFFYAFVFGCIGFLGEDFRYVTYAIVVGVIILIVLVRMGILYLDQFFWSWLRMYSIAIGVSTIFNPETLFISYFYQQAFLLLIPIIFIGVLFSYKRLSIKTVEFWEKGVIVALIIVSLIRLLPDIGKFDISSFSFLRSQSPFESGLSHLMGMVVVYCLIRGHKWLGFLSFFLMFLFMKRIAIAACLFIIFFKLFLRLFKSDKLKWNLIILTIIGMNFSYFLVVYDIIFGHTLETLFRNYTGLSLDGFTLGRYSLYRDLGELLGFKSFIIGEGIGQVNMYLRGFQEYEHIGFNPHTDALRLVIEIGMLFYIAWLIKLYRGISTEVHYYNFLLLPLFMNLLMFTDNVLLYHYMVIPFFAFSFFLHKLIQFK